MIDSDVAQGSAIGLTSMALYYAWKVRGRRIRAISEAGTAPQWRGMVEAERILPFQETLPRYEGLLFVAGDELRFRPSADGLLEDGVVARVSEQNPADLSRGVVVGRKGASTVRLTLPPEARFLLHRDRRSESGGCDGRPSSS